LKADELVEWWGGIAAIAPGEAAMPEEVVDQREFDGRG